MLQSLTQEMTVIVASRHCDELSDLCTRALVIAGGRLVADTALPNLQRDSRHFQAVTLTAESPLDLLALAVLPGVAGIEEHRHAPGTVTVLAMPGHTIYPHINTLIASRRWKINALNQAARNFPTTQSNAVTGRVFIRPRNPLLASSDHNCVARAGISSKYSQGWKWKNTCRSLLFCSSQGLVYSPNATDSIKKIAMFK